MSVIRFILTNWDSVLVILAFLALIVIFIKRGETAALESVLFELVTGAEQEYGEGTGALKFAVVADWIYARIPAVLKPLFSAKDVEKLIEGTLKKAKIEWSASEKLQEYIRGTFTFGDGFTDIP